MNVCPSSSRRIMRPQYKNGHFQWSGQLAQVVERLLRKREVPRSISGFFNCFFFCIGLFSIIFKDDLITNNKRTRVDHDSRTQSEKHATIPKGHRASKCPHIILKIYLQTHSTHWLSFHIGDTESWKSLERAKNLS